MPHETDSTVLAKYYGDNYNGKSFKINMLKFILLAELHF